MWALKLTPEWVGTDAKSDIPLPDNVRRYYNPGRNVAGVVVNQHEERTVSGQTWLDELHTAAETRAKHRDQVEAYEGFAQERGWKPAALGLAWLLHQPGVTGPIIGPRTVAQLESAVTALDIELSADDLRTLDEIFPGPGGQAPEAYAW